MARKSKNDPANDIVSRSSSEQAEANEHNARNPQSPDSPQGGPVLTGHTTEAGVVEDEGTGKVQAAHQTTVVTDPESDLAVQFHPNADATAANPLGVHAEPSPNEVADGADPVEPSVEDIEGYHDATAESGKASNEN